MEIRVTFRNMKPSEAVRSYAVKKLEKISKFLPNSEPMETDVVLSLEKHRHIADVVITGKDLTITAKEETDDIYSAIDLVSDAVEKQAKRHRDRIKTKKSSFREVFLLKEGESLSEEVPGEGMVVVRVQRLETKPMAVEEAVMQLESSGGDFIVFNNAESGKVSVLYRMEDGTFGLYEAG